MEVILRKDIPSLGRIGEVVRVREGYARNFLIPRSMATIASRSNKAELEHHKRLVAVQKKKIQKESQALADSKKGITLSLVRRFNESGKMYGAVTSTDLVTELSKVGLVVDKRDLEFDSPKEAGAFELKVRLPGDIILLVSVSLEAEAEAGAGEEGKAKGAKGKTKKVAKPRKAKSETSAEITEESSESEDTASE